MVDKFKEQKAFEQNKQNAIKVPPQSLEAERYLIGGVMLGRQSTDFDEILGIINSADFYQQQNRLIFSALESMHKSGNHRTIDLIMVMDYLKSNLTLEQIGEDYLKDLVANATPTNLKHYANLIRQKSILRHLINVASKIMDDCYFPQDMDVNDILDKSELSILKVSEKRHYQQPYRIIGEISESAMAMIEEAHKNQGQLTGVPTGFTDLDKATAGWQKSDLIILAARPGMGKTTLALNLVENAVFKGDNKSVAVFSLEMSSEQLALRMFSAIEEVPLKNMRDGKLTGTDFVKITEAITKLMNRDIYIDSTASISVQDLKARVRRIDKEIRNKQRNQILQQNPEKTVNPQELPGLSLVVVDYLQLMRSGMQSENRATEVAEISRSLKAIAKEMNIPVIALSQLNRDSDKTDRKPKLSDLRESGAIEQDADIIMFIHRNKQKNEEVSTNDDILTEIIISKFRNGEPQSIFLNFKGKYTKFTNALSYHEEYNTQF